MGDLSPGSLSLADRRVGSGRERAARRPGAAARKRPRHRALADRSGRGSFRPAACRIVELHHRERTTGPVALRHQLGRAAVEPDRPRRSISPRTWNTMSNLHAFDIAVIAAYFLVLAGIGYWAARREKNVSADYFLASRDVGWFAVGASLFASNIGSEHLVGLAGTGAASGLAVGHFEWLASFILLLLGWLFVPFYLRSGVYTMPEFLERRYNPAARSYFTWVSIVGYVLTKISVTLFAGGVVMRAVTGYDFWTSAAILIVITGLYTIFGGLRAVIYTEVMQ